MVAARDFETPLEVVNVLDSLIEGLHRIPFTNDLNEDVFAVEVSEDDNGIINMEMSDGTQFAITEVRKVE